MESIITEFYKNLGKGKILGSKCGKCGYFAFPPKLGCQKCGAHKMKLKKICGDGTLFFYSSGNLPPMKFVKYHPYAYGVVELKEGPAFLTQIEGVSVKNVQEIEKENMLMPRKVKAKVKAGRMKAKFKKH